MLVSPNYADNVFNYLKNSMPKGDVCDTFPCAALMGIQLNDLIYQMEIFIKDQTSPTPIKTLEDRQEQPERTLKMLSRRDRLKTGQKIETKKLERKKQLQIMSDCLLTPLLARKFRISNRSAFHPLPQHRPLLTAARDPPPHFRSNCALETPTPRSNLTISPSTINTAGQLIISCYPTGPPTGGKVPTKASYPLISSSACNGRLSFQRAGSEGGVF